LSHRAADAEIRAATAEGEIEGDGSGEPTHQTGCEPTPGLVHLHEDLPAPARPTLHLRRLWRANGRQPARPNGT
jgi:hypothetical protein